MAKAAHLQPRLPLELLCSKILIQMMGLGKGSDLAFVSFSPCVTPEDDLRHGGGAGLGRRAGLVATGYQAQGGGRAAASFDSWVPSSKPLATQPDVASLKAMLTCKPQRRASVISPSPAAGSALGKVPPLAGCGNRCRVPALSLRCPPKPLAPWTSLCLLLRRVVSSMAWPLRAKPSGRVRLKLFVFRSTMYKFKAPKAQLSRKARICK